MKKEFLHHIHGIPDQDYDEETRQWHGEAFTTCYMYESGKMYIDNGEYCSQVNFCPLCGLEAKVKINDPKS